MKTCNRCNETKTLDMFPKDGRKQCKACKAAITAIWKAQNKEHLKKSRAEHYALNKDKEIASMMKWREVNKEYVSKYAKEYASEHKAERASLQMRRHARKVSSEILKGDEWNDFFISELYDLSRERSEVTGIQWHVDHIVPLQGKAVSGLHVWYNLQVIPAAINVRKSNTFIV